MITVLPDVLDALDVVARLLLLADGTNDPEQTPEPEDVKAGWTALVVVIGLIVAVVLLLFSMTRHVRKVRRNEEAELDAAAQDEQDETAL